MAPVKRPPMPARPLSAPASEPPTRRSGLYLVVFFFLFAVPLFILHLKLLTLPFFWDEQGQFIPTALDILRHGWWVARSTVPNAHPPGVEAILALFYKVLGYSIPLTRVVMLLWAALGLLMTFLLAIKLSAGTTGAPAFLPPLLMLVSPLFYMQSFMAQLDMPSMVLTVLALYLFLCRRFYWCAAACVALVLVKETGVTTPFIFFCLLAWRKDFRHASLFMASPAVLAIWFLALHRATGYWLGDPGFAHYNVGYALNPVRILLCFLRHVYYVFFAEMRIVGTAVLAFALWKTRLFRSEAWAVTAAVAGLTFLLVTVLGGAELERYLLPVLPFYYIAVAVALTAVRRRPLFIGLIATLFIGLFASIFWNPPYPFPYENNWAMVDFVNLQRAAGQYADDHLANRRVATAWPYSASLRHPEFGFVERPLHVIETNDFHPASIRSAHPEKMDALITYTRTWQPDDGVVSISFVRKLLSKFYEWQPDIDSAECAELGFTPAASWTLRGQTITVYVKP